MKYFGEDVLKIENGGTGASNDYLASLNTKSFYLDLPGKDNVVSSENQLDECKEPGTYKIKINKITATSRNINMLSMALNGFRMDEMQNHEDLSTVNSKSIIGTLIVLNTSNEDDAIKVHQLIFGSVENISGIYYRSGETFESQEFINIADSIDADLKDKIESLANLATTEKAGLMSPEDKIKLNNINWRFGIENNVPYVETLLGTATEPPKIEDILSIEAGGTGVDSYDKIKGLLYDGAHGYPEGVNIDLNTIEVGKHLSTVYLQGTNQASYHTPLWNSDVVSYYNVDTFGTYSRATQIATTPFTHQQGAYIRFKHDDIWCPWMQLNSSNENLLINWDFTNPVDQRGNLGTVVNSALIYCMDRWRISTGVGTNVNGAVVSKTHYNWRNCISVTLAGQWSGFTQLIYIPPMTLSQHYTLSFVFACTKEELMTKIGSQLYIHKNDTNLDLASGTNHCDVYINEETVQEFYYHDHLCCLVSMPFSVAVYTEGKYITCGIYQNVDTVTEFKLFAAKLEVGNVSTLPLDPLGTNHDEEYQKCLRYYYGIFNKTGNAYVTILDTYAWGGTVAYPVFYLPVPMRRVPTLYYNNIGLQLYDGGYPLANITLEQGEGMTGYDGVPLVKLRIWSADANKTGANEHWLVNILQYGYIAFDAEI